MDMETIGFIVAIMAILTSIIALIVFYRARNQWNILSSGCWNGEILLELADGNKVLFGPKPGMDVESKNKGEIGSGFSYMKGKIILSSPIRRIRICGAIKYSPKVLIHRKSDTSGRSVYFREDGEMHDGLQEHCLILSQDLDPHELYFISVVDGITDRLLEARFYSTTTGSTEKRVELRVCE